jgi:hypothetical protein
MRNDAMSEGEDRIVVRRDGKRWCVYLGDEASECHDDRDLAIGAALKVAAKLGGSPIKVQIVQPDGQLTFVGFKVAVH